MPLASAKSTIRRYLYNVPRYFMFPHKPYGLPRKIKDRVNINIKKFKPFIIGSIYNISSEHSTGIINKYIKRSR